MTLSVACSADCLYLSVQTEQYCMTLLLSFLLHTVEARGGGGSSDQEVVQVLSEAS